MSHFIFCLFFDSFQDPFSFLFSNLLISLSSEYDQVIRACVLRCFRQVQHLVTPSTVAHQPPLSMGVSRQEYRSRLPCRPPGELPDPAIEPMSLLSLALQTDSLTTEPPGKAHDQVIPNLKQYPFFNPNPHFSEPTILSY